MYQNLKKLPENPEQATEGYARYFDKDGVLRRIDENGNVTEVGGGASVEFASVAEVLAGTVTDKAIAPNTAKAIYEKDFSENNLNKVGYLSTGNTFGVNSKYNVLGTQCIGNTFGDNTTSNTFGNSIINCIFGVKITRNTFGSGIEDIILGHYSSSNTFGDSISNLVVLDSFQMNTIESNINFGGINFSLATHVYAAYHCRIFKDSTGAIKLSYVDGSGVTRVVAPNA